jgi:heme ABC exporter ATP-binding subunit CcmA
MDGAGAATGDAPVVELVDAVAVFGGFPALAGASLTVRRSEILWLRGPNGAGKTTLLRLCAGLVPLARGHGQVLGRDLTTHRDEVRSLVGVLGHHNGLYLDLTVRENVTFWARAVGASAAEVDAALDRLGLAGRLEVLAVRRLSAGQQRRTALACLVARRAELWLLDEPHSSLDADGRADLDAIVLQAAASGATVIIASHEYDRARPLATRVVEVTGGLVVEAPA